MALCVPASDFMSDVLPSVPAEQETRPTSLRSEALPATPAEIIRMEANFLHFPFFALSTRGLREHEGVSCTTEKKIGDERHEVTIRVTRNSAHAFPGPLSRKIHFALLAKLQEEQHVPYRNPITWSWYDLAGRIGLKRCTGGDIRQMKDAIESTLAAYIRTRYSLSHSDHPQNALRNRDSGYHLYERCVFVEEPLPDGTTAGTNHLWLSDWYLANLNSHYCGPIDYGRWLFLNNESRIASRLYEYLIYNFSAGMPVLRIRYERLAQFLPVQVFTSLSRVRQQLEPALKLLQRQHIVEQYRFDEGAGGGMLIVFEPGTVLKPANSHNRPLGNSGEVRRPNPVEAPTSAVSSSGAGQLVRSFYERWIHSSEVTPSPKELALAEQQLALHGEKASELLPIVVKLLRQHFPAAQNFGATRVYWLRAATMQTKQNHHTAKTQHTAREEEQNEKAQIAQRARKNHLRRVWQELDDSERQRIAGVVRSQPGSDHVRRAIEAGRLDDPLAEMACLKIVEAESLLRKAR